jgi:hypothetical protein
MTHLNSPAAAQKAAVKIESHGPVLLMGLNRSAERNASASEAE